MDEYRQPVPGLPGLRQLYSLNIFYWALALLTIAILIRLPFFFHDVLNWDESTFILMGQSIVDGHLPYTQLWDLKPPFAFFAYAAFIFAFGKTIIAIRLAGSLCVALVAIFVYWVGKATVGRSLGFLAALLTTLGIVILDGGQATMTEHIALVPLITAFSILFLQQQPSYHQLFATGLLMTAASLVRLNLAYPTILVGLYVAIRSLPRLRAALFSGSSYALGGCLAFLVSYLPYLATGQSQVWWSSVIIAPLNYSGSQLSLWESFQALSAAVRSNETIYSTGAHLLLWLGGCLGPIVAIASRGKHRILSRSQFSVFLLFLIGVGFSILQSGGAHEHYLIQLVPFMALGAAISLRPLFVKPLKIPIAAAIVLLLLFSLQPVLSEYRVLIGSIRAGEPLQRGSAYEIADYLRAEQVGDRPVYMMTDHIVYWLIGSQPLTRATTHPSNISKQFLLPTISGEGSTPSSEMQKIFAKQPEFVVKRKRVWYLTSEEDAAARAILEDELATHYQKVAEFRDREIYRRRPAPTQPVKSPPTLGERRKLPD